MGGAIYDAPIRAGVDPGRVTHCGENYRSDPAEGSEEVRKQGSGKMVSHTFLRAAAGPRCRILSISNSMGVSGCHGLVGVAPDDAVMRVIKELNGAYLQTRRIGVKKVPSRHLRSLCVCGDVIQAH